jgi:hypothetical protein
LKRIAIQDANILIDLINCGLLEHVLSLDFTFFTTSIIRAELATHQDSVLEFYVEKGLFEVISISSEEFTMILEITSKYSKLSSQDCSALFYSEKLDALTHEEKEERVLIISTKSEAIPFFCTLSRLKQLKQEINP